MLKLIKENLPEPQPGEARVKVLAADVSAYDLMFRRSGLLPGTLRVPFTLGTDVIGAADRPGEDVTTLTPGQMVAGATFSLWPPWPPPRDASDASRHPRCPGTPPNLRTSIG